MYVIIYCSHHQQLLLNFCIKKSTRLKQLTKYTLVAIMTKHVVQLVNKQFNKHDLRKKFVNNYLKVCAPTVYEPRVH